jgi:hypothetical protein
MSLFLAGGTVSASSVNTFTFTGSLRGMLHVVPDDDCAGASGTSVQLDTIEGKLKGSNTSPWTIIIAAQHAGTSTIKRSSGANSFVLETPGKSFVKSWEAASGSFTTKGSTGGTNVTLVGATGGATGTLHLTGRWDCPASTRCSRSSSMTSDREPCGGQCPRLDVRHRSRSSGRTLTVPLSSTAAASRGAGSSGMISSKKTDGS